VEFDPTTLPPNGMYKLLITHVHDIFEMKRPNPDYRG